MNNIENKSVFSEITTEEASKVNGGVVLRILPWPPLPFPPFRPKPPVCPIRLW